MSTTTQAAQLLEGEAHRDHDYSLQAPYTMHVFVLCACFTFVPENPVPASVTLTAGESPFSYANPQARSNVTGVSVTIYLKNISTNLWCFLSSCCLHITVTHARGPSHATRKGS